MNKLKITLNATEVESPSMEISDNFEYDFIEVIKKHTDLNLALLLAERTSYRDGKFTMIVYTFNNLTENQAFEFESFSKKVAIVMMEAINRNKN